MSIILGSGGHTQEMLLMMRKFDFSQVDRLILISSFCDKISEKKFVNWMRKVNKSFENVNEIISLKIPRTNRPKGFSTILFLLN